MMIMMRIMIILILFSIMIQQVKELTALPLHWDCQSSSAQTDSRWGSVWLVMRGSETTCHDSWWCCRGQTSRIGVVLHDQRSASRLKCPGLQRSLSWHHRFGCPGMNPKNMMIFFEEWYNLKWLWSGSCVHRPVCKKNLTVPVVKLEVPSNL